MIVDLGLLKLLLYLSGPPADPWYGPLVIGVPLGILVGCAISAVMNR
jgi:hypothetical protein